MKVPMIEHVAEALWQAESVRASGRMRLVPWSEAGDANHRQYRSQARAAIESMREPTEKMIEAGQGWTDSRHTLWCWQEMIAAALLDEASEAPQTGRPEPIEPENCATCKFWRSTDCKSGGECRRKPPKVFVSSQPFGVEIFSLWTNSDHWCGEWKQAR